MKLTYKLMLSQHIPEAYSSYKREHPCLGWSVVFNDRLERVLLLAPFDKKQKDPHRRDILVWMQFLSDPFTLQGVYL